jgi:hypothetical protein
MITAVLVLIGMNVLFLVAARMKKTAATADGLSVEGAQLALTQSKQERFALVTRLLRGQKNSSRIERDIVSAGLLLKPSEFYMINLVVLCMMVLLGFVVMNRIPNDFTFFSMVRRVGVVFLFGWMGLNLPRWVLGFLAGPRYHLLGATRRLFFCAGPGYGFAAVGTAHQRRIPACDSPGAAWPGYAARPGADV